MKVGALSGRVYPDRKPRRIGGKDSSEAERKPALLKMRASNGELRILTWTHQCRCGSVSAKRYRGAWWCWTCGREKLGVE